MTDAHYLRCKAAHCLQLARSCFDLGTAEQLRLMAADLMDKAQETDDSDFPQHLMKKNGQSGGVDRD
jgi:hypothetical protein